MLIFFHKLVHYLFNDLLHASLVFVISVLRFGVGILQENPKVSVLGPDSHSPIEASCKELIEI